MITKSQIAEYGKRMLSQGYRADIKLEQ